MITAQGLLVALIIGAIAGWLAGEIVKGHGQGLVMNIIIGIIGALIAGWLLPAVGLTIGGAGSILGAIIYSTIGAVILLLLLRLINRA
ncbi:GlsB/YeaQ/YmgE family stress response membrane protein [Paracoccus pacificus]|uniref:GlsB/YeaQ/YmgE family stress response membrane protein n=1 Tax=Paracoccus pacificus TaxID=1463598 RepID=A0ABW4R1Y9_9RHOB